MVKITFHTPDGEVRTVDAVAGQSLMRAAVDHQVQGIEAACGGSLACGTCHGYVDERWLSMLPAQGDIEKEMLEYGVHVQPNSRLTCQIPVSAEMDGMVVRLPPSQR